jgi:hypothetical protein
MLLGVCVCVCVRAASAGGYHSEGFICNKSSLSAASKITFYGQLRIRPSFKCRSKVYFGIPPPHFPCKMKQIRTLIYKLPTDLITLLWIPQLYVNLAVLTFYPVKNLRSFVHANVSWCTLWSSDIRRYLPSKMKVMEQTSFALSSI